jgi:hypothetical protein
MEVSRISVSKDGLRAMPKAERTLLLLMGHASNQITALARVLDFYRRNTPSSDAEKDINSAQYHMFARFLIGVVFEGWRLIETRLLKGKLGKEYIHQLEAPPREAFNALKKQFGGSILAKLRNDVAFHHPHDAVLEAGNWLRVLARVDGGVSKVGCTIRKRGAATRTTRYFVPSRRFGVSSVQAETRRGSAKPEIQ